MNLKELENKLIEKKEYYEECVKLNGEKKIKDLITKDYDIEDYVGTFIDSIIKMSKLVVLKDILDMIKEDNSINK